jgi:UDP-3-O-[3-hydroxymyristoyl] glucosamine N-acyltransferase
MFRITVEDLARECEGKAEGDLSRSISGANALEHAVATDLSFVANAKAAEAALSSKAGCLIVPFAFDKAGQWALIRVAEPRIAFARVLPLLYPAKQHTAFLHPTALIAATAQIGADCHIGPYVTIGENTTIAAGSFIGKGSTIGDQVTIGENATVHPNVTVYDRVRIGARVVLHSGAVIGADGFGFTLVKDHYEKFPQVGIVEIGDDVEIGANSCVDRAALGATRIGDGTKLDNLVHVAHNCTLGKHVVAAAQVGLSGSVTVGDYAVLGGQAGIADKAKIEPKAVVGAKSGVVSSQRIPAGEPVWGMPARPLRQHLRGLAHVAKLPELREELRQLKKRIEEIDGAAEGKG